MDLRRGIFGQQRHQPRRLRDGQLRPDVPQRNAEAVAEVELNGSSVTGDYSEEPCDSPMIQRPSTAIISPVGNSSNASRTAGFPITSK